MFLVVKYHIIRPPPPPAGASLLNKPKSQKSLGHWISKNHGPWISKNSWTMNFEKFMDHEFQKIVGHWFSKNHGPWISKNRGTLIFKKFWSVIFFFYLKNLKFSKIYGIMFWFNFYIDFVWYIDFMIFWYLDILIFWKPVHSWKTIYFSYSKYIIFQWWIIAEREEVLREMLIFKILKI